MEEQCFKKQGTNKPNTPKQQPTNKFSPQDNHNKDRYTKYQHKESGIKPRPATVNWSRTNDIVSSIKGTVNGHTAEIILDTGAQITVVPEKFIYEDNLTGDSVDILGINGDPRPYQTAKIPIIVNKMEVDEVVAVAPEDQLNSKVLLATPMCKTAKQQLINSYIKKNKKDQVTTKKKKATPQQVQTVTRPKTPVSYSEQLQTEYNEDDRASDVTYNPDSEYTESDETSDDDTFNQASAPINKYLPSSPLPSSPLQPQNQTLNPEPYSSTLNPEPYSSTLNPEPYSSNLTIEPNSSTQTVESDDSSLTSEPYSSHSTLEKNLTNPDSSDLQSETKPVKDKSQDNVQ